MVYNIPKISIVIHQPSNQRADSECQATWGFGGWCERNDVSYSSVYPTEWKKAVLDKGNATKKEIRLFAEKFTGSQLSQDEADAVCILLSYTDNIGN